MRFLITGAQGFVGRYLTAALLEACPSARVIGVGRSPRVDGFFSHTLRTTDEHRARLPSNVADRIDERFSYEQADLLNVPTLHNVLVRQRPDVIFHLASALRSAMAADLVCTNILGTVSLFQALRLANGLTRRIVVASTGGVYGDIPADKLPARESTASEPVDAYAATKLAAEHIARSNGHDPALCVIIARIFNVLGPGQDEQHVCGGMAAQIHSRVPTLRVRGLHTTRDFIDVRDVAHALVHVAARGECGRLYNIASGVETSIASLLERMVLLSAYRGQIEVDDAASVLPNVVRHYGDPTRLLELGFRCKYTLEQSLRDLLSYYGASADKPASA
jgi:nucleoside-diphosphate-sugar epimerase